MQFPFVSKQLENLMRINCRVYILKHSGKHNQKTTQSNLLIDISSKASVYIFFTLVSVSLRVYIIQYVDVPARLSCR